MTRELSPHSPAQLAQPQAALAELCARVRPVAAQRVNWREAAGRVLAETVVLDRPSPACDVSEVDGYAMRRADGTLGVLRVSGELPAGMPAQPIPPGQAMRVSTGAMIPVGADAVIPREQLREDSDRIELPSNLQVTDGQHIRRRGENGPVGTRIGNVGQVITPPVLAAIASCGHWTVQVRTRVRVAVITTGGEVSGIDATPAAWQLRDGNGPALWALLAQVPWLEAIGPRHVIDEPLLITEAVRAMMGESDAILLTGGVSAGDHDHVPAVLRSLGASIVFHKLAIRPGKPVLGAVDAAGRPMLGLPGNPVSAMVTARRFAIAALRVRAGIAGSAPLSERVDVADPERAPAGLVWFPLARLTGPGRASLVRGRGSGDWVAASGSDGFVEVAAGESARGFRPFYRWAIS